MSIFQRSGVKTDCWVKFWNFRFETKFTQVSSLITSDKFVQYSLTQEKFVNFFNIIQEPNMKSLWIFF